MAASWTFLNGTSLMTSPRPVPIFDGHNDVLLRLYRRGGTDVSRAFLEGEAKGQLDLPMARQGGFVGGLFAIFVPSSDGQNGPNDETASQRVSSGALSAPAVELAPAQRAVLSMVSLLLRIERESKGRVRICRNVTDIQQALKDDVLAPVLHIEGAEAIDPNFELLDVLYEAGLRSLGPFGADPMRSGMACRSVVPHRPTRGLV
jgi:membrane dipeptidase